MRSAGLQAVLVGLAAAALVGCTNQPIYAVSEAPVETFDGRPVTMAEVEQAIARAGAALGWRTHLAEPGLIVASYRWRGYTAVVQVAFGTKTFSITYRNSANLNYDGTNIHRTYNDWIRRLETSIRAQLRTL